MLQSNMGQVLNGNFGAAAARNAGVQALQAALRQLGSAVRDGVLMRLAADGRIGPGTVSAVNRAFTTHIGAGQAPAQFRTGRLTSAVVVANAMALAQHVQTEAARRLAPAGVPTARSGAAHFVSGNPRDLQTALRQLGTVVRDGVLMKVAIDGRLGPGTVSAVNRAFTTHIGSGQAPAQYRTGRLTAQQVTTEMANLTPLISREAARRATLAVTTGAGRLGPGAPVGPALPPRQAAIELQQALNYLAQQSGDKRLKVAVDGKLGAGTVKAVNIALTTHVGPGQAPAGLRTGTLSISMVTSAASQIGTIIRTEAARRATRAVTTGAGRLGPGGGGAPVPMGPPLAPRAAAMLLQQGLAYLGRETRDRRLAVKADGKLGPATVKATNIAFSTHIGPYQAGGVSRAGDLTLAYVVANAQMLGTLVNREAARRHFGAGAPSTPGTPGTTWVPGQLPGGANVPTSLPMPAPASRATIKLMQTRLAQLGRMKQDGTLMIGADGVLGPRTIAAANRALTAYLTSAPQELRTGSLSKSQVSNYAATISEYAGQTLRDEGTNPATEPPSAEVGPNAEGEGGAVAPGADPAPPPPPPPGPQADEGGGGQVPGGGDPGGGGGGTAPDSGGGGVSPQEAGLIPGSEGGVPWVPIAIGVGLAAAAIVVVLVMKNKSSSGAPTHAYKQPARRRAA